MKTQKKCEIGNWALFDCNTTPYKEKQIKFICFIWTKNMKNTKIVSVEIACLKCHVTHCLRKIFVQWPQQVSCVQPKA